MTTIIKKSYSAYAVAVGTAMEVQLCMMHASPSLTNFGAGNFASRHSRPFTVPMIFFVAEVTHTNDEKQVT